MSTTYHDGLVKVVNNSGTTLPYFTLAHSNGDYTETASWTDMPPGDAGDFAFQFSTGLFSPSDYWCATFSQDDLQLWSGSFIVDFGNDDKYLTGQITINNDSSVTVSPPSSSSGTVLAENIVRYGL